MNNIFVNKYTILKLTEKNQQFILTLTNTVFNFFYANLLIYSIKSIKAID